MFSKINFIAVIGVIFTVCLALNFGGCGKMSPTGPQDVGLTERIVQSNTGPIEILSVDKNVRQAAVSEMSRYENQQPVQLFKYTDPSQYFVEQFVEGNHDVTLKVGDGTTGESKVELKKLNLPSSMTVFFEWAPDDETYTGRVANSQNPSQRIALNAPVKVELSYKMAYLGDVDESSIALYMYNESTATWDYTGGEIDYSGKKIRAYINRFGKMALYHIQDGDLTILHKVQDTDYYARKFLKASSGGKLEVEGPDVGKSYIDIKDDDLPCDMTVSFEWAAGEVYEGLVTSLEYGTSVVFKVPVAVRLSYKNAKLMEVNEYNIGLFVYNESIGEWEQMSSVVDIDHQEVDGYVTRFGKIALLYVEDGVHFDLTKLDENVFYARKYIKAHKGGGLDVGNKEAGRSKIKFKKYDLPKDADIKFEWAASNCLEGRVTDMQFGPHGIKFNCPVEVWLSCKMADLTDIDEDKLQVFYYNEETDMWELIGGEVDKSKKKVKVHLPHFSRYALAISR